MENHLIDGMWMAYSEAGLAETIGGKYLYCWATKKEALRDLMSYKLEPRKRPKIRRVNSGKYEYTPGDCDNYGMDAGVTFTIARVTRENVSLLSAMLE